MKVSLICTVLNEEKTITHFLRSILLQTRLPDEVIIVDGGSTDATRKIINLFQSAHKDVPLKLLQKNGNRSVSRNFGITSAHSRIILLSDAGCRLDKRWVVQITEPFKDPGVDVVSGYYSGRPKTIFEKCLIPYVLIMPDKTDEQNFLPSSRSMAFRRSVWEKTGGFPEKFSHNEDYVFAKKLKKMNARIVFQKKAIVYWDPRKNLSEAFIMFFRFALGDAESGIFRTKVFLLFVRYVFLLAIVLFTVTNYSVDGAYVITISIFFYWCWSVQKNYRYVKDVRAIFYLPMIQLTADVAVLSGTLIGLIHKKRNSYLTA